MSEPLVSIIIPVYNGEKYVREAIDSALAQNYGNIEVIVCNDGSKDSTDEIVRSYGDRVKYISKENGGVATALNTAIENATGKYVSWLSHDDLFMPNKIQWMMDALKKEDYPEDVVLFSNFIVRDITNDEEYVWKRNLEDEIYKNSTNRINILKLLFKGEIHGCSLLIPREAFHNAGFFDPELLTTQDYHLWYKFVDKGYRFIYIDEPLIATRWHPDQDSKKKGDICIKECRNLATFATELFFDDIVNAEKYSYRFFKDFVEGMGLTELVNRLQEARSRTCILYYICRKLGIKIKM